MIEAIRYPRIGSHWSLGLPAIVKEEQYKRNNIAPSWIQPKIFSNPPWLAQINKVTSVKLFGVKI